MKKLTLLALTAVALVLTTAVVTAGRNESQTGTTTFTDGKVVATPTAVVDFSAASNAVTPFKQTLAVSANATTALTLLADSAVPAGKRAYISTFVVRVNGTNAWSTNSTLTIQDSAANAFATVAATALTSNATVLPSTSGVTLGAPVYLGTGGNVTKGIQLLGTGNATGSDAVVTVFGVIK